LQSGIGARMMPSMRVRRLLTAIAIAATGCTAEPAAKTASATTAGRVTPAASVAAPPAIGDLAPEFTLSDQTGRSVTLSEAHGRNVVLVFYRGHW